MDSPDFFTAEGLPFTFSSYKVKRENSWQKVTNTLPGQDELLRVPK